MPRAMLICGLGALEKPALVAAGDKEASSCTDWTDLSLFSFAVNRERTVNRGCNIRGVFSKLSNVPTFHNMEVDKHRPRGLVHFQIVERRSLESLENIPHFPNFFRGLKRSLPSFGGRSNACGSCANRSARYAVIS